VLQCVLDGIPQPLGAGFVQAVAHDGSQALKHAANDAVVHGLLDRFAERSSDPSRVVVAEAAGRRNPHCIAKTFARDVANSDPHDVAEPIVQALADGILRQGEQTIDDGIRGRGAVHFRKLAPGDRVLHQGRQVCVQGVGETVDEHCPQPVGQRIAQAVVQQGRCATRIDHAGCRGVQRAAELSLESGEIAELDAVDAPAAAG